MGKIDTMDYLTPTYRIINTVNHHISWLTVFDQGERISNTRLSRHSANQFMHEIEEGRETTELVTKLNTWDKDKRFVVSRVMKPKNDSGQLFFWTVMNSNTLT